MCDTSQSRLANAWTWRDDDRVTCAGPPPAPIYERRQRTANLSGDEEREGGQGGHHLLVEEAPPQLAKPPLYRVVLLNDDYTPMEFVVDVLERIFGLDRTRATFSPVVRERESASARWPHDGPSPPDARHATVATCGLVRWL